MSADIDHDELQLPFKFIAVEDNIELEPVSYDGSKKPKLRVSAGIFEATSSVEGEPTDHWRRIVSIELEGLQCFLTLHALQERLQGPAIRRGDSDALIANSRGRPFELWDETGTKVNIPTTLILRGKTRSAEYNADLDASQLQEWEKLANRLGGKPAKHSNPSYGRFRLRPSDALKEKAGKELIYCSPGELPAYGITKDNLETIIAANTGKFLGWPDPVVVDFDEAKRMSLKLVGVNFLQLYVTWMKAEYYEELWKEFGVTELLHAHPAESKEQTCQEIDKTLTTERTKPVDEVSTTISSRTPDKRKNAGDIMGKSATVVAEKLWGEGFITSGMGGSMKVEWLHRVAHSLGGPDVFGNLVFGTWECNTDMIRAENVVKKLVEKVKDRKYEGKLTTNRSGKFFRPDNLGKVMEVTIPSWATKYSWLCFSLNYRYEMDADKCPLDGGVLHEVDFDPWAIYTPLSMESRLDIYILEYLKSEGSKADVVSHKASIVSNMMAIPQPLPNIPPPEYPTLAWNAAINGLPSVEIPGIAVKNPTIATPPIPNHGLNNESIVHHPSRSRRAIPVGTPVPQGGFVLEGQVNLFGTAVVGNLEKWIGPTPGGVVAGSDPPSIERVVIPGDFHMSMLIPLLRGTPFDSIIFRNVAISYQNYAFDETKSVGWHFNADWVIDSSCGLLYDVLKTALQVDQPILSIRAAFGKSLQWSVPLNLQSFILEGVFPNLTLSPVSGLTLTSIGVRLLGIRGFSFTPEPHSTLSFGFGVFGTMKLDVPGSVIPLNLDYEIGLAGETVNLRAEISGSIWEDALGVEGLLLNDVVFWTSFSATSPLKTFAFDVSATFTYLSSVAFLQGSYAAGGHFSFTAELDNFGISELNDLFYTLFGGFMTLPDFDVHIGSATVSIVSGQGLSISLLDVSIAGYTAASLEVTLSSSGASLSGALSSSAISFGDVELRDALIKLTFWTTDKQKNVDFMLGGKLKVDFLDLEVGAAVHLYPGEGGVEWAVVAELSAPSRPFAISDVVPAIRDTFVDFSLRNAVIIAASQDDSSISQSFPGYDVRKGVQVFGVIDSIQALNDLLREEVTGLVFNAGWSKASGFNLLISLSAESSIDLGNGVKTTPITLGIRTSPIELGIMAGVTIPVKDSTPLDFSFVLAANEIGASASAQLEGWWVKPFGIDNLKIGPEVTLSIEIVYAQFVATGTPSGFGVSGGLMIGTVEAFLAVNISEDPQRQLLYGDVKKLDISDVVEFAGTLVQQDIPKIPDNLLKFEELKVYICPFGVVLGKTVYPQGFSFKADLLVFEKRANIECTIDKVQKSVDIVGGIDNFELGPLTVHGSNGPRATLECHIGVSKQQLTVDGVVSIFDAQAQTYIDIQFLPDPKFKYYSLVQWADIFMFKLDAELLGSIHDRLSDADFSLNAELENNILEYIAQQVIEQFEAAKVAATQGLEAAQQTVNDTQRDWENAIADAQKKVDDAQTTWESYEQSIRSSSQPIIDNYLAEITRLQGEIDGAQKDYENALGDAQRSVDQANADRAATLASAQRDVDNARLDLDNAINDAQQKLDDAKADLSRAFGNAQRDIDSAQRDVDSIQSQIDSVKGTISDYEDAPWYRFDLKAAIAGLWVSVGTLEASKAAATGVLDAASGVLTGSEYVSKQGAVEAASQALDLARSTGEGALSAAQGALSAADETSKAAVDAANATLEGVKQGGEYVAFEGAKGALEAFKQANEAAYEAALAAINGLMDSAEFVAFNAAKAGLEVANASTTVLDAAKEALVLVEKASQAALSILEEIVKFAGQAVNINTVILSGTLRGILGVGGDSARPLTAVIKGYVVGQAFDINAEFDPRKPVEFITAIFKQLWDLVSSAFRPSLMAAVATQHHVAKREAMNVVIPPGTLLAARSRFLQQRPDVLKMLTDKSPTAIPRAPFSGRPIVSSVVVARKALILMQKERGISVLHDLD